MEHSFKAGDTARIRSYDHLLESNQTLGPTSCGEVHSTQTPHTTFVITAVGHYNTDRGRLRPVDSVPAYEGEPN